MNAVQIIQNLCVKLRQLLVQTDDPVSLALAAFFLVRTAAAILALNVISRQELVVSHVVAFHSHECCVMVGFGVTVAFIPTYFNAFRIFFQPLDILGKLFNEPLFRSFVISLSVNGFSGVETDKFSIFLQNSFKIFDSVFLPNIEFHAE